MRIGISIPRHMFVRFQYGIATSLLVISLCFYMYQEFVGDDIVRRFLKLFDVGNESSLPTWFSSVNLLLSSVLLFLIFSMARRCGDKLTKYWLALCILFLAFSIDEVAAIHERAGGLMRYTGPIFPVLATHSWILYGAIFSILVLLLFIPFLRRLPRRTALIFLLAGCVFVSGALGFEFVGAWMLYTDFAGRDDLIYNLRRLGEEGGEMYGIVIFNCALFDVLSDREIVLSIKTN